MISSLKMKVSTDEAREMRPERMLTIIRQVLEPKVISTQIGLFPLVTLLSMILYALAFVIVLAVLGVLMVAGSFYYYSSDVYIPIYLAGAFLSIVVVGLLLAFLHRLFAYRFLGCISDKPP